MATLPIRANVLAFAETAGWMLYGLYDVLGSVGTLWPELVGGEPGEARFEVHIVAADKGSFACWGGVPVLPQFTLSDVTECDVVCVPELTIPAGESPVGRYPRETNWLQHMYRRGATIASACSGAFLLADAGLLDGDVATTHWAYEERFASWYPQVTLHCDRVLCFAGEDRRIVTAGGTSSWHDMCLYLIARFCGIDEAIKTAKAFLFEHHDAGQRCFSAMRQGTHDDAVIHDCLEWLTIHYASPNPIAGMIERSRLAPRTFARRFRARTGHTPIDYVRSYRVERAKNSLEKSSSAIDDIGREVGYEDPASFRRLFKAKTGLTPSEYRRKFQARRRWTAA